MPVNFKKTIVRAGRALQIVLWHPHVCDGIHASNSHSYTQVPSSKQTELHSEYPVSNIKTRGLIDDDSVVQSTDFCRGPGLDSRHCGGSQPASRHSSSGAQHMHLVHSSTCRQNTDTLKVHSSKQNKTKKAEQNKSPNL